MAELPRILVLGANSAEVDLLVERLRPGCDVVVSQSLDDGVRQLQQEDFAGVLFADRDQPLTCGLLEVGGLLQQIPDGIVLLDLQLRILWCNTRLQVLTGKDESLVGSDFYQAFGSPEIMGPDFCPFHTALGAGESARSTLKVGEKSYFEVHAQPVSDGEDDLPRFLVVIVRDISEEVLQRQKLNAIYQAGLELGDLAPQDILDMSISERVELLKSKILIYTKDLLEFETVEIRLLDEKTKRLEPLLALGMQTTAASRVLYAEPQDNGVTGFVAATGKSYLCEDTANDPLYLSGAADARSSLTVPLTLHDEIHGTFNVESTQVGAFSEYDLQFLELFSREVAVALNTLELLVAQKMTTVTESTEKMLQEVAHPVDEILNDAAWVLERYIGHEPNVCDRLQRILKNTREIKQQIQRVGETIAPEMSSPLPLRPERPKLKKKRILVVDGDESVRRAAHEQLGRFGCEVETAHDGDEAFLMARSFHYDAVIADIRLPDMTGYDCFSQLKNIEASLPVILMTGFGYDPTHSIVKARQEGLKSVLYKPFRLDQLIAEVEKAVSAPSEDV